MFLIYIFLITEEIKEVENNIFLGKIILYMSEKARLYWNNRGSMSQWHKMTKAYLLHSRSIYHRLPEDSATQDPAYWKSHRLWKDQSHAREKKRCGGPHSCNWMLRIRSDTHHLTSNSLARTNHMDPHKERKLWRAICVQKSKSQVYFLYNVSNCCTLLGVNSDFRTKIGRFLIAIYEFPLCWILQS